MKLTRKLKLGIGAIEILTDQTKPVRTGDIATQLGTTLHFMEQVMAQLRKAGITSTVRGPGGGNVLSKNNTLITAHDVAVAVKCRMETTQTTGVISALERSIAEAHMNTDVFRARGASRVLEAPYGVYETQRPDNGEL